ncbi:MAG: alpha-1,2-fucosyltransferase [Thiobacillus sp.]|nr:alpha-1,2-fucosyltransferase [Thiobacillus sp.]
MNARFCLPRVRGRGAGLGNELIPWARAAVAGHVLGARTLAPAFGLNPRRYRHYFDTPRLDWLGHRLLERVLPRFEFTEADFLEHGGAPLSVAIRHFAERHRLGERSAWVMTTQGMWGGYRHVIEARDFVFSRLYLSNHAAENLATIQSRLDPARTTVGMHVRLGDFHAAPKMQTCQGQFNVSLPIDWYTNIARSIVERLGDAVQFLIVSDGTPQQLAPLLDSCKAITTLDIPNSDISDLLALANTDLLVCSVSSYSAWAAFLSDAPYLWFEPNLQQIEGYYSIWGHEPGQLNPAGYTRRAMDCCDDPEARFLHARGVPVRRDGALPESLFDRIAARHRSARPEFDLVCYGAVPVSASFEKTETRPFSPEYPGAKSPGLQTLKTGSST